MYSMVLIKTKGKFQKNKLPPQNRQTNPRKKDGKVSHALTFHLYYKIIVVKICDTGIKTHM